MLGWLCVCAGVRVRACACECVCGVQACVGVCASVTGEWGCQHTCTSRMISSITLGIAEQPGTLKTGNSVAGMLRSWSVSSSAFSLLCENTRARGT